MISDRITYLRRYVGITQNQLAKKLHISPSTIGMYEQGRREPNINILISMAEIFNVSLDFLITGKEYDSTKYSSFVKPLTGQEGLNDLIDYFLGEDWIVDDNLSCEQINAIAVNQIKSRYRNSYKSRLI